MTDTMTLKLGRPGNGPLTPRRQALAKEGMKVGQWRKKAIAARLAPKADPECRKLLLYLVREGYLKVLETEIGAHGSSGGRRG